MSNTKINSRQLKSVSGSYESLYHEIRDFVNIQADNMMDVDISYVADEKGNIIREVLSDTSVPPVIISDTEYVYNASGGIDYELTIRGGNRIKKTYRYDTSGNIVGVSIRVNP